MLDREQYLLGKAAEESCEVGQRAIKAQLFGMKERQEGKDKYGKPYGTNEERLVSEFYDLMSIMNRLRDEGFLHWSYDAWQAQDTAKGQHADTGLKLSQAMGKTEP